MTNEDLTPLLFLLFVGGCAFFDKFQEPKPLLTEHDKQELIDYLIKKDFEDSGHEQPPAGMTPAGQSGYASNESTGTVEAIEPASGQMSPVGAEPAAPQKETEEPKKEKRRKKTPSSEYRCKKFGICD
ncbi:MAG: hypothetical protein HY747_09415 [Elusimicrobia bacterium]|nr:hypothetical protein [Elusimicrobiota bacterium]